MTRPFIEPAVQPCMRPLHGQQQQQQQQQRRGPHRCSGPWPQRPLYGSYSASMASMAGQRGLGGPLGGPPAKKSSSSSSSSSSSPPVSDSHILATSLEGVYPPNTCKDSGGLFNGLVGAIERHILHSNPSGNVKIASSRLHIGECFEVPEHLGTFALRRSGSLHFRQPQEEAAEEAEQQQQQQQHSSSSSSGAGGAGAEAGGKARAQKNHKAAAQSKAFGGAEKNGNAALAEEAPIDASTTGSSGSSLTSAEGTPRAGGLRRTFSWHRIKDKLRR